MKRKRKHLIACLFAAALFAVTTPAMVAITPIWEPTVITGPGHYMLTRDIEVTDQDAIVIQSAGVTLDLNGYTIRNSGTLGVGVLVQATPQPVPPTDVRIVNGRITGGQHGVHIPNVPNGVAIPAFMSRLEVSNTSSHGIFIPVPPDRIAGFCVFDVFVHDVDGDGIRLEAGQGGANIDIAGSFFEEVGGSAIRVDGASGRIEGNVIRAFGTSGAAAAGIHLGAGASGLIVAHNVITEGGAQASGIDVETVGLLSIKFNVVCDNGGHGMELMSTGSLVTGNTIYNNGLDGILDGGTRNLIEGNNLSANGGCGINFDTANDQAFRNNMLRGNNGGSVCGQQNTDAGGNIF